MAPKHVIYEPEWVIETSGASGFTVECECGWKKGGFDTASKARAAAFDHSTDGAALMPESSEEDARRRRFWGRR